LVLLTIRTEHKNLKTAQRIQGRRLLRMRKKMLKGFLMTLEKS